MERTKLSHGLRLLSVGEIVTLVGALGLLGSMLMMVQPLLSDRLYNSIGLLRLGVFLVFITGIATLAGAVIGLVARVKLRGEHPDYRTALILTLVALGVNLVLTLLELEAVWVDVLELVCPFAAYYLTVRATNEFLARRGCEDVVRMGRTAMTAYFIATPLGTVLTGVVQPLAVARGPAGAFGLLLVVSAVALVLSVVPGVLSIRYFRRAAEALEQGTWDEPVTLDAAE